MPLSASPSGCSSRTTTWRRSVFMWEISPTCHLLAVEVATPLQAHKLGRAVTSNNIKIAKLLIDGLDRRAGVPIGEPMSRAGTSSANRRLFSFLCARTRKSTSGGCVMVGSHFLKARSSKQASLAFSSGEAEYYAVVRGVGVAVWMQSLYRDIGSRCGSARGPTPRQRRVWPAA